MFVPIELKVLRFLPVHFLVISTHVFELSASLFLSVLLVERHWLRDLALCSDLDFLLCVFGKELHASESQFLVSKIVIQRVFTLTRSLMG